MDGPSPKTVRTRTPSSRCSTYTSRTEWIEIGPAITAFVRAYRDEFLRCEAEDRKRQRRDQLRLLRQQVLLACTPLEQQVFPRDGVFYQLPSVKPLWEPEDSIVDPATWSAIVPSIRGDVQRQIRHDKVWCCDQLARALHKADIPLPDVIMHAISQEPSPFIDDRDESKGLAPLHDQLTDVELEELLDRPVSLFTCSDCCGVYSFGEVIQHLRATHHRFSSEASCLPAPASYLQLFDRMLEHANLDRRGTTRAYLAALGDRFTIQLRTGKTLWNQPWKVVVRYVVVPLLRLTLTLCIDNRPRGTTPRRSGTSRCAWAPSIGTTSSSSPPRSHFSPPLRSSRLSRPFGQVRRVERLREGRGGRDSLTSLDGDVRLSQATIRLFSVRFSDETVPTHRPCRDVERTRTATTPLDLVPSTAFSSFADGGRGRAFGRLERGASCVGGARLCAGPPWGRERGRRGSRCVASSRLIRGGPERFARRALILYRFHSAEEAQGRRRRRDRGRGGSRGEENVVLDSAARHGRSGAS